MEDIDFIDNELVDFIIKHLPKEMKTSVNRDDVDYLLDLIYDFYEEQGFFSDEEASAEVEINEQDMINYVSDKVAEDGRSEDISYEMIAAVLDGEYEYGKSKGIY